MSKFALILYKRRLYLRAHDMFTEAASLGGDGPDDELSIQCQRYAQWCRQKLVDENGADDLPLPSHDVKAEKPRFETSLIPITDGHNATMYSEAVYSRKRKMLTVLGVDLADLDESTLPSGDTDALCDVALECLLKRTENCRAEFASEFEGLLIEKFH